MSNVPIAILDLGTKTNLIIYNPVQSNLFQKLVIPKSENPYWQFREARAKSRKYQQNVRTSNLFWLCYNHFKVVAISSSNLCRVCKIPIYFQYRYSVFVSIEFSIPVLIPVSNISLINAPYISFYNKIIKSIINQTKFWTRTSY